MVIEWISLIHYTSLVVLFVVPTLALAISQGLTAQKTVMAIDTQPGAAADIKKMLFFGMALNETAAILNGIMTISLFLQGPPLTMAGVIAQIGILCSLGIPCLVIAVVSSFPHQTAISSVGRQPFAAKQIFKLLLITLSVMQTSVILGLIVSFMLKSQVNLIDLSSEAILLCIGGVVFGVGTVGPLIGLALFAKEACETVGKNMAVYQPIVSFTFLCQGLIEAPILFVLMISLLIISRSQVHLIPCLAATLTITLSTLGAGIASGWIASSACRSIGLKPQYASVISRTSLLAQTLLDALPIYGLIISLVMLFYY